MPVINSLLDADFYKFTMGKFVWRRYPDVPVKYQLTNRTKNIKLADCVKSEDLRVELERARTLRFSKTEIHYLRGTNEYGERMFCEPYLQFLEGLQLPPFRLGVVDGDFEMEFAGKWAEAIYWETLALSILNELYFRTLLQRLSAFEQDAVRAEGIMRLKRKIDLLRSRPDIIFCDFGTRRRFSFDWQDYVVGVMAQELPKQFLGTSNTLLAMRHGLLPMGTNAHELGMAISGIMHGSDEEINNSHKKVLEGWWDEYGYGLSIALTDTYGTDAFFRDFSPEQAKSWKGLRQDSGDPFRFVDKTLAFYARCGVDAKEKMIVFSDGLDLGTIIKLADYCAGKIKCTFGWGTNLANDLGFKAISIVVKLVESCGFGTVKLSDNLAKAIGRPEDVERFKRIFGYTSTVSQECRY